MKNYQDGGEAILEAFRNLGVDCIFSSPGSEWSPLWEAMARQTHHKNDGPRFFDCWHETVAADMALGYTAVTGRMQAVLVHAGVGLMHGSMAMLTATQTETPMVVLSGELTSFGEEPDLDIEPQWYGGVSVGGADKFVAPIVKYAGQVTHPNTLYQSIIRAGELAQRPQMGPVYLDVSLEAMLHPWTKPDDLRTIPAAPKVAPLEHDAALVAAMIAKARNPVIVADVVGRDPAAFAALVALADALALPVIGGRGLVYCAFPANNPLWQGFGNYAHLADADLILLIGGRTPWYPPSKRPGPGTIVAIGDNPIKRHLAYQNLQADHYLEGDLATSLGMLAKACKAAAIPAKAIAERRARWTGKHEEMKARLTRTATEERAKPGISPIALACVAAEVLPADTIFTDETITHMPVMRSYLPLDRAQSFFRITGGALGQGIAAALGIKLAAMERPVVLFVGDGSFLYNPIIQALGASKTYALPIVVVVCNNRRYEAMRKGHVHHYAGGVSDTTNLYYGVEIEGPEYHELGRHFGFHGAKVDSVAALGSAFKDAIAATRDGRTAILNVVMTK